MFGGDEDQDEHDADPRERGDEGARDRETPVSFGVVVFRARLAPLDDFVFVVGPIEIGFTEIRFDVAKREALAMSLAKADVERRERVSYDDS